MKKQLLRLTLALAAGLLPGAVQADDVAYDNYIITQGANGRDATEVIRCVPASNRMIKGDVDLTDTYMAKPVDGTGGVIDIGTFDVVSRITTANKESYSGRSGEVLFTVLTSDASSKTGTVAVGGVTYRHKDAPAKGISGYDYTRFLLNPPEVAGGDWTCHESGNYNLVIPSQITVNSNSEYGGKYAGYTFTVTELADDAFLWAHFTSFNGNDMFTLYLPATVKKIGNRACNRSMKNLQDIKYYKVNADGTPAWQDGKLITGDENNNIESVGAYAFHEKTYLTSFTSVVGSKTSSVGAGAFCGCEGITSIDLSGATSLTELTDNIFFGLATEHFTQTTLHIPDRITKVGAIWGTGDGNEYIPGVNPEPAFYYGKNTSLTEITGMNNVTELDLRAYNQKGITSFTVPASVNTLHRFSYPLSAPDSRNEVSGEFDWYYNNYTLQTADFSKCSATVLPDECFLHCAGMTGPIVWGDINTIGKHAFRWAFNKDAQPQLSDQIVAIGEGAFMESRIAGVDMSAVSLTDKTLPKQCFYDCPNLNSANITLKDNTITTIGKMCFMRPSKSRIYDELYEKEYAGYESKITDVQFLSKQTQLTNIDDQGFYRCAVASLDGLPESVARVGIQSFADNRIAGEFTLHGNGILQTIDDAAFEGNRLSYLRLDAPETGHYHNDLAINRQAFGSQRSAFTVEFTDASLDADDIVPTYIKDCPFTRAEYGYEDADGNYVLAVLRVIVPTGYITPFRQNQRMEELPIDVYRVKFKWGSYNSADAGKDFADRSYYEFYNITPQQRLIATTAWKNDVLNFRPNYIGDDGRPDDGAGKPHVFETPAQKAKRKAADNAKRPQRQLTIDDKYSWYSLTVDYWDSDSHVATPLPEEDEFFSESEYAFNTPQTNKDAKAWGDAKATGNGGAANTDSYPWSLMPYTVHMFHANVGNDDEPEQIARRAVTDGLVPPGEYLVPAAYVPNRMYATYAVGSEADKPYIKPKSLKEVTDRPYEWIDLGALPHTTTKSTVEPMVIICKKSDFDNFLNGTMTAADFFSDATKDIFPDDYQEWNGIEDKQRAIYDAYYFSSTTESQSEWPEELEDLDADGNYKGYKLYDIYEYEEAQYDDDIVPTEYVAVISTTDVGDLEEWTLFDKENPDDTRKEINWKTHVMTTKQQVTIDDNTYDAYSGFTDNADRLWVMNPDDIEEKCFYIYRIYNWVDPEDYTLVDYISMFANCVGLYRTLSDEDEIWDIEVNDDGDLLGEVMERESLTWSEIMNRKANYGFNIWVDIFNPFSDPTDLVNTFYANQDAANDHNIVIGLPDRYPIFPYWAESPYPFQDAAHDVVHADINDRFSLKPANETVTATNCDPLWFNYKKYGRMGKGVVVSGENDPTDYGTFVNLKNIDPNNTESYVDNDIHYVNFGISKGYFVQVKTNPLVPGNGYTEETWKDYSWTQPGRAYFSVSRAHVPHMIRAAEQGGSSEVKLSLFREGTGGNTTGINTINNEQLTINNSGWYTLDGRKLNGKPTQKGIYIHDGRKEVVR